MVTREAVVSTQHGGTVRKQLPLLEQKFAAKLIPPSIQEHLLTIAEGYGQDMVLRPNKLNATRFIVEEACTRYDQSIVARMLLIAEFGKAKSSTGPNMTIPAHVEDWMATLMCERHDEGILLFAEELYVARSNGWERVHQKDYTRENAAPMTSDGAEWPAIEHRG